LLKSLIDAGVPVLVVGTMIIIGMELTLADFRRVARQPGIFAAALLGQLLLLPLFGWVLVHGLKLRAGIAQGILLVVACPSGGMANVYTLLARASVPLSVSLTAASCLAAVLTTPLILTVFQAYDAVLGDILEVPFGVFAGELVLLLVLPVLTGMLIRRRWPLLPKRHGGVLLGFSLAALATLLGLIIVEEAEQFARALTDIAAGTALLTVLAFGAGWATARIGRASSTDSFAIAAVFVVRNVGIATAIAVTILGRIEFAVFATAYFLVQAPILFVAAMVFRCMRGRRIQTRRC